MPSPWMIHDHPALGDRTLTPMEANPRADSDIIQEIVSQSVADIRANRERDKADFVNVVNKWISNGRRGKLFSGKKIKSVATWIQDEWLNNPSFVKEIGRLAGLSPEELEAVTQQGIEEARAQKPVFSIGEEEDNDPRFSLGVPYQGSKNRIAKRIIDRLPEGRRFVDLMSGGGAMTHAAMLSGKYGSYRMNDINDAGQQLFLQGARGEWDNYDRTEMTDEEFAAIKGTPEALPWSYSGLGRNLAKPDKNGRDKAAEQIRRVKNLSSLRDKAGDIDASNVDYRGVILHPGDVVYADIPYEGTDQAGYGKGKFNKQAFVEWAQAQDVPIFVSEYTMPEGWVEVESYDVPGMKGGRRTEKLWVQDKFAGDLAGTRVDEEPVRFDIEPGEHVPFVLSEKKDAEGNHLYERNNSIDLWDITPLLTRARRQIGPIRLSERNMKHIIKNHSDRLDSEEKVFEFLDNVFANAKKLRRAKGSGIFVVVEDKNTDNIALIKMMPSEHGEYYNIDTAGYYRKSKWKESEEVIADLSEPSQSDAVTDASNPQVPNKDGVGLINTEAQLPSSVSKDRQNNPNVQENPEKTSEKNNDVNLSIDLKEAKEHIKSIEVPKRITSMAQAADWTYRTLGNIRNTLNRLYGDEASRDFTSGLLTSDPTKGREIDTDAASYSSARINQYLDFVQPLLYQARDNSTSKEARKYFEEQIDEANYARQWYDRAAEGDASVLDDLTPLFSIAPEEDRAYMDAVEKGDERKTGDMVLDAARRAGYLINANHGTTSEFTQFKHGQGEESNPFARIGYWFSTETDFGKNWIEKAPGTRNKDKEARQMNVFLKLSNPKVYEVNPERIDELKQKRADVEKEKESIIDKIGGRGHNIRKGYFQARIEGYSQEEILEALSPRDMKTLSSSLQELEGFVEEYNALDKELDRIKADEFSALDSYDMLRRDILEFLGEGEEKYGGDMKLIYSGLYKPQNHEKIEEFADYLKSQGYDGIVIKGTKYDAQAVGKEHIDQYVVFDPEQIKSADPITRDDNGNVIPLSERFNPDNDDIRFSIGTDDQGQPYDNGDMPFDEMISKGLADLAQKNKDNVELRVRAMRGIGGNLAKLRQAMSLQRTYDRGTVDSIVRMANMMMGSGIYSGFTPYEVRRLMGMVNRAAGREDITKEADKVVDQMLNHQLKELDSMFKKQLRTKATKIDNNGVEVQAGLDIAGQRMMQALKDGMDLEKDAFAQYSADVQDRMFSDDEVTAKNAAEEWQGVQLAQQYNEEIKNSKDEEKKLRKDMRDAEDAVRAGTMDRQAYNEFVKEMESTLRENKLARTDAYLRMMEALGGNIGTSRQRAKEWQERELRPPVPPLMKSKDVFIL